MNTPRQLVGPLAHEQVTDVRSGRHRCSGRLVVDLGAPGDGRPDYRAGHVQRVVMDGPGTRVPLRQVAFAGSFEGWTMIGLGVRARLPMRAFVLDDADGGHRVVVDVAHRWY